MMLMECFDAMGGDYDSVRQRIPKDEMIERFLKKFLADPCFDDLNRSLQEANFPEAFRAAHSLKGVCYNLGLTRLGDTASVLTELLREKDTEKIDPAQCEELFQKVAEDYQVVTDSIKQLDSWVEI